MKIKEKLEVLSTESGFDFSLQVCNYKNINAPASRKVRWGFSRIL